MVTVSLMLLQQANPYVHNIASQMWIYVRNISPYLISQHKIPAVCIDLDGTIWSEDESQHIFVGVKEALDYFFWHRWMIYFITARRKRELERTMQQLTPVASSDRYVLYMRDETDRRSIFEYKQDCRRIVREACDIVLCVGNELSDMNQEDANTCYNVLIPRQQQGCDIEDAKKN